MDVKISDELYRQFQAALMLRGESASDVLSRMIISYSQNAFSSALDKHVAPPDSQEFRQKQMFIKWFKGLYYNGRPYSPNTINGYAEKLETSCQHPIFSKIHPKNLFSITNLDEFIGVKNQIQALPGYASYDGQSHSGFTAALRKYQEFLQTYPTCQYPKLDL